MDAPANNTGAAEPGARTADAEFLASYLASRDVPCPGCRYNLRGCTGGACPECGRAIALTLEAREAGVPHRMFLLLALGWVLLAGTMNTVRFVGTLMDEYRWAATGPAGTIGGVMIMPPGGGAPAPFPIRTLPVAARPVTIFDLSATSWMRALWAGGLVLGAIAGLLALEREWRGAGARPPALAGRSQRVARLVVYSWALFGLYASWHFVVFARELLGLR